MLVKIVKLLKEKGLSLYIVGESVKNSLMNKNSDIFDIYVQTDLKTLKEVLNDMKYQEESNHLVIKKRGKEFNIIPTKAKKIDNVLKTIPINVYQVAMTYDGKLYDPYDVKSLLKKEKEVKALRVDLDILLNALAISLNDELNLDSANLELLNHKYHLIQDLDLPVRRDVIIKIFEAPKLESFFEKHPNILEQFYEAKLDNLKFIEKTNNIFLRLYTIFDTSEFFKEYDFDEKTLNKAIFLDQYKDYTLVNSDTFIKRLISEVGIDNFKMYLEYKKMFDQAYFNIEELANSIIEEKGVLFVRDLNIKEYELIELGYDETKTEKILQDLLFLVFDERIDNNKLDLTNYVRRNYRYK